MNPGNGPHNSNTNSNNNRIPMSGYGIPVQQGGMPLQQGGMPLQQGGMPLQQGGIPFQHGGIPIQQGGMPFQQGGVPIQSNMAVQGGMPVNSIAYAHPGVMQGGQITRGGQPGMPTGGNTLTTSAATPGGQVSSSTEAQSAHSSGAMEIPPLPTSHVKLPNPVRLNEKQSIDTLFFPFFKFCPEMWAKYVTDYDKNKTEILKTYINWANMIRQQSKASQKSPKEVAAANLKSAVVTKKSTLEEKVRKRIQDARNTLRDEFHAITVPTSDDEKRFLPSKRARHLLERTCGPTFELTKEADIAFELLAQHFVEDSVSFAVAMARRRPKQNSEIRAKDVGLFYKSALNLIVPVGGTVDKYRYVIPKGSHKAKVAAARKENFAQGKQMYPRPAKEQKTANDT